MFVNGKFHYNINTLQDIVCLYQKMNNTVECDKIIKCKGSHLNLFFNLYYRKYTWIFIILWSPSVQTKGYKIGMCCFSAKHVALRRKRKKNYKMF